MRENMEPHHAPTSPPEILVVDDLPENLKTLGAMLSKHNFKIRFAQNGNGALRSVASKRPDLVLLDIRMPDMDGYAVCKRLKKDPGTEDMPIIFISALADPMDKVKAFEVGGVDYITKPFNPDEVLARISTHLKLRQLQQQLTSYNETLEQKVADRTAELLESRNQYSRFVEGLPIGTFRTEASLEGRFLMANPAAVAMLGCNSNNELYRFTLLDFQCDSEEQRTFAREIEEKGYIRNFELSMSRRDGTVLIARISAQTINGDNGVPLFFDGVMEDITEWRTAQLAKEKLENQLRQAQKMEAIGSLAGGIAHDFNNILGAIMGHTELALQLAEQSNIPTSNLKEVLNASLRAKELIRQILAFSRQQESQPRPVALQPICKEVVKLLTASLPATIKIRTDFQTNGAILADPVEVHQVLMNLATNGAYALRDLTEGVLEFQLREVEVEKNFALANRIKPGRYLRLSVGDNGCGMPPEVIDRIFEPFFTTKGEEGTGLGLSMVHGIVKSFDGAITVYSEPDLGTTVSIYWPILTGIVEQVIHENSELPGGNESILCVDDEEIMLCVLEKSLSWLGYDVTPVTSGTDALARFREAPGSFDLVLTDETMPKLTGTMLAGEIKQLRDDIPVILCTGNIAVNLKNLEGSDAITRVIMKPLMLREVAAAVRDTLDGKRPVTNTETLNLPEC